MAHVERIITLICPSAEITELTFSSTLALVIYLSGIDWYVSYQELQILKLDFKNKRLEKETLNSEAF